MAEKNVKPAAKAKGAPGKATKPVGTTSTPTDKVDQTPQASAQSQGETAGARLQVNQAASNQTTSDTAQLNPGASFLSSTGNQEQLGTPAAGSAAASERAQPGADQSFFADSSPKSIPGLAVTSSRDGFWRCGRQWTKDEQRVALADLTEEQFHQLVDEPMLTVAYVDLAEAPGEGA